VFLLAPAPATIERFRMFGLCPKNLDTLYDVPVYFLDKATEVEYV
jgi:hypothetical protein